MHSIIDFMLFSLSFRSCLTNTYLPTFVFLLIIYVIYDKYVKDSNNSKLALVFVKNIYTRSMQSMLRLTRSAPFFHTIYVIYDHELQLTNLVR